MARLTLLRAGVAALLLAAPPLVPDGKAQGGAAEFLVQQNCLDARGEVRPGILPTSPDCTVRRPAVVGGPLGYRKHDWPGFADRPRAPLGYQASDALLGTLEGRPAAIVTFDFGTGGRAFGRFDGGADGGEVIAFDRDRAVAAMTEDGGGGVQWLHSPLCRAAGPIAPGWLYFDSGSTATIADLAITPASRTCPRGFSRTLTRWNRGVVEMPALLRGAPAAPLRAEMIVSDHFSHPEVAASDHLERNWFARGLGRVRWERWQNLAHPSPRAARWRELGVWFAGTGRCAGVTPPGNAPGPEWVLVDCRTWTNFDLPAPGTTLRPLDWPAADRAR